MKQQQKNVEKKQADLRTTQKNKNYSATVQQQKHPLINAQSIIGNHGVLQLLGGGIIQRKLKIGHPNDKYEREADWVAEDVTRMPDGEKLQTKNENNPGEEITAPPIVQNVVNTAGQPLDNKIKNFMESHFGYNFSNVKIHNDTIANQSSNEINALAYTYGNHIVFGAGQYAPETERGKHLLSHELTHTIQQKNTSFVNSKHIQRKQVTESQNEKYNPKLLEESLKSQYPYIYKFLSDEQRKSIVKVFLFRKALSGVEHQLSKLSHTTKEGSWYLSEDEPEIKILEKRSYNLKNFINKNSKFKLDTTKLLDASSFELDKSGKGGEASEIVSGYKRLLYMTVSTIPTFLEIQDVDPIKYAFQAFKLLWGKNEWVLPNDGGKVTFKDLMKIESFNIEYQEILMKGQLQLIERMEKLAEAVKLAPRRAPDDPVVLSMSKKNKLMKALSYSKDHFSAADAAERVFGKTPGQIALNIGIMIGSIIALAIIGSLGPIGALAAGSIAVTLLIIFWLTND